MTRPGGKDHGLFERDGAWWIRYADEHGREHREKVGPKGAAKDLYTRRRAAVKEKRFNADIIRRRERLVRELVDEIVKERRNRAGARNIGRYGELLNDALGDRTLRQVTARDVDRYRAARQDQGVSEQTIYHELSLLRTVFRVAVEERLADKNPVRGLKAPKAHRVRYLTDEEETALLAAMKPKWRHHVLIAINTGMRLGEQFSLKRKQIDWQARVVKLPKTKSGWPRTVPLNDAAVAALKALPRSLRSEYVFVNRFGKRLNLHNFHMRIFRPAVAASKLKDFRWHDLRHTFASRLVQEGADLRVVADLLGHRSLQMVMRYAHLAPGAASLAVSLLDQREKRTGTGTGTSDSKGQGGDA